MADIDFKNSVNVDTAYVDGHKVKLIAVPDGTLELPISANDEYGYVIDANGKKHRVLLVTFLEGEPDYKQSPTADTAYMTVNTQKVKVRLGAKLNGTQYLSNSANVNDGYTEDDDGNKHRTILVAEPTGTWQLPTSETSDSAYVIDNDGNKHKVRLFAVLAGGTTIVEVTVSGIPPLQLLGAVEDSLTSLKAFGGTKLSNVPLEYTQIDGAIKTGNYSTDGKFNTGVKITNDDVKIEVLVKAGNVETQSGQDTMGSFYCCQARSASNAPIYGISGSSTGNTIIGVVNGEFITSTITRTTNHLYFIRFEYKNGNQTLYVKDLTTNTEDTKSGTYTFAAPTTNFYIFGNSATQNRVNAGNSIYSCKIWDSGTLVFDSVSVKRDSDNAVGLYDSVRDRFIEPIGVFNAGNVTTPTPSDPVDLVCNNGALKVLDKSQWTIFTNPNPDPIPGQGVWLDTNGKWKAVSDNGAGCAIPLTIGKQYTMVIHKKTIPLGTMLRYGQSPQATPTSAGIQLTDWYRGTIQDGQIISFVAKQPYFVMQLNADPTEAGMIQEAIEVLEAQGGDYTFLDYITATGTQYIQTTISGPARWVGAGQGTSDSNGSKCILSAKATTGGDIKGAVIWLGSRYASTDAGKKWTLGGAGTGISMSNVDTTAFAKYDVTFADDKFIGKINDEILGAVTNNWSINEWRIGTSFANQTGNPAYYFVGNIYRQTAYQNNVLVGDFIPAIRNSDNVVGMYDTVSGTFFTNAGTGTFVAGTPLGDGEVLKLTPSNDTAGVANLFKIDNYVDTQEILTGLINHQLGIYVFDGTEDWTEGSTTSLSISKTLLGTSATVLPSTSTDIVCTHYQVLGTSAVEDAIWVGASNVNFRVRATYATISDWKTFLAGQYSAGTPVIIVYPLATEYAEPAPIAQTMNVVAGDNTLSLTQQGMTPLEVSATYMKGVSVTITEIENANVGNNVEVVIA